MMHESRVGQPTQGVFMLHVVTLRLLRLSSPVRILSRVIIKTKNGVWEVPLYSSQMHKRSTISLLGETSIDRIREFATGTNGFELFSISGNHHEDNNTGHTDPHLSRLSCLPRYGTF